MFRYNQNPIRGIERHDEGQRDLFTVFVTCLKQTWKYKKNTHILFRIAKHTENDKLI